MDFRLVEIGYKLIKLGKHAVSCPMGALRGISGVSGLSGVRFSNSVSTLALSAVMSLPAANSHAEVTLIDGGELSGFLVGEGALTIGDGADESLISYQGSTVNINTEADRQTIFTGFVTQGGAGSGGGAGLGGVFFVNEGAALTLRNVVFAGNSVKGGTGGGEPSQRVGNTSVAIATKSIDVFKVEQQLATPELSFNSTTGRYQFGAIDVSATGPGLLKDGTPLTFGTLSGTPSRSIQDISGDRLILDGVVEVSNADVVSVDQAVFAPFPSPFPINPNFPNLTLEGYTVSGNTIDLTTATDAQRQALADAVELNSFMFIDGVSSRVTSVGLDENGDLESIVLADDNLSGRSGQLDVISISGFTARQFEVSGTTAGERTITLTGDLRGFEPGMALFDDDGNAIGVTVDQVLGDGSTVVVKGSESNLNALANLDNFLGRKSPILSTTQIALNSPRADFYDGASVFLSDIGRNAEIQTYDPVTGVITFTSNTALSATELATLEDLSSAGNAVNVQLNNIISASGSTIRVRADGLDLQSGMELQGPGIPDGTTIDSVSVANGVATINLSDTVTPSELSFIVAKSPLSKGGNMNGIAAPSVGGNGANGFDSNGVAAFFNGGEGQEGTRGYSGDDCSDGSCGVGGDGGVGGNGSDGMPINPQALADVIDATGEFIDSTGELVAAVFPDPVVGLAVPLPDPLEIAGATLDLSLKSLALATAIYENVQWGINLSRGIAGLGGDGGEGGEAGGGSDFFGGGAGGAGGNGGEGALSFTDGGSGGDGGRGGDGGFGAGGGQGGAGGESGSTGAADGGNPGDGGFAGFGAGDGSNGNAMFGGGGSGFGGAIFVREGGTLNIEGNAHFLNNVARGGSSTNRGAAGDGAGAGMFIMKDAIVRLAPGLGRTITFDDDIADNSSASYEGAQFAEGEGADLTISGNGGLVVFNAENTYSGDTIIEGATLQAVLGEGVHESSRLRFNGVAAIAVDQPEDAVALALGTVGTLIQSEDLVERRVGNDPFEIKWSGSGGFASSNAAGISINLGETIAGVGQNLVWGADGFFEGAATSALTFGSEQSRGGVTFMNDVQVGGNRTATVAVYNTGSANSSFAVLSGDWDANRLVIGQASAYNGTVYMTGDNTIDTLHLNGGRVSTFDANTGDIGRLSGSTGGQIALWNTAELDLYGSEAATVVTVDVNATLRTYAGLQAGTVVNSGTLEVLSGELVEGSSTLTSAGTLGATSTTNQYGARLVQQGNISSDLVANHGDWNVTKDVTLSVSQLTGNATGEFCLETDGGNTAVCDGAGEDPAAAATALTLSQSGDSAYDGVFAGLGSLQKTGAGTLTLRNAQTFTGGLTVSQGAIATGVNGQARGTFADSLAIAVSENGRLDLNNSDVFGSLTNAGVVDVDAVQSVVSVDNQSIGQINLRANMSASGEFRNDGTIEIIGDDRALNIQQLTGNGAIDGNDSGVSLTVNQSGTSTYGGSIIGVADLVKTGAGVLTLTGSNVYSGLGRVEEGKLVIGTPAAMAATNDYHVYDGATLQIASTVTGSTVAGDVVTVANGGTLDVDSGFSVTSLTNAGVADIDAAVSVANTFTNDGFVGRVDASAAVTARNLLNNGLWNVAASHSLNLTGTGSAGLTGAGDFCLETIGADPALCAGSTEDPAATATTLTLNQLGNSTFNGVFLGLGSLVKTDIGTVTLTQTQSFNGGLIVDDGGVIARHSDSESVDMFADSLNIVVNENGALELWTRDNFATLTNAGSVTLQADQTMVSAETRGGDLYLRANATTSGSFGVWDVEGGYGVVHVEGDYTVTADAGLVGDGDIVVADTHNLTLSQQENTISTFSGTIGSTVTNDTSVFTFTGGGELILSGDPDQVSVSRMNVIDGRISLDGTELLDDAIAVEVQSLGELMLLDHAEGVRTESIHSLAGSGKIYLGRNTLNVVNGGDFQGEFFGNGSLNVESGDLAISASSTDVQGELAVDDGGGIIFAAGVNRSYTNVTLATGAEMDVSGARDAATDIQTNDLMVDSGATLHMGPGSYENNAESFSTIQAQGGITIRGAFLGSGTIAAPVIAVGGASPVSRANIRPGDSPGVQMFMGDRTVFGDNTDVEIEVLDYSLDAGFGYDQLRFKAGGVVVLEGDVTLSVRDLAADGTPPTNFNTDNYDLGRTIQFARFDPLAITGKFDTINHLNRQTGQAFVVNLATGSFVGIANRDLDDTVINANQQAMLDGMRVSEPGNIEQYYGGRFIENLTATWANNGNLDEVYERASPEVYAGLSALAQSAALNAVTKWGHSFAGDGAREGTFVDISSTNFTAEENGGAQMAFGTRTVNTSVGFSQAVTDNTSVLFNLGTASTNLNGDYTVGEAQGLVAGLALAGHLAGTEGLYWNTGVRFANLEADGERHTNNGVVSFSDVDTTATQFNIGLEYFQASEGNSFGIRGNLVFGSSRSDAFGEAAGAENTLDAMYIEEVSANYARLEAGVKVGTEVSDDYRIFGTLDASMQISDEVINVVGSYDNGQASFGVGALGLNATSFAASIGIDRDISENGRLTVSVGTSNDWQGDNAANASLAARFSF